MKAVPITVKEWKGLNTSDNRATFEDGFLVTAKNVDIPDSGTIRKRPGLVKFHSSQPTGTTDRLLILGRHTTSSGDWIIFQTVNSSGVGLKIYRMSLTGITVSEITLGGASITGRVYGYQYNDVFYLLRSSGTLLSVSMLTGLATSIASSPSGSSLIAHKGRLWVLDGWGSTSVTRIYYSTTSLTWGTGDAGNIDIRFGDGDPVMAAAVISDTLLIFKGKSTWTINADSPDPGDWVVRNVHDTLGCIARDTVQVIDGLVYFLSARGVYTTDGITPTEISNNISPTIQNSLFRPNNFGSAVMMHSAYFNNRYILGDTWWQNGGLHLVYNIRLGTWSTWDYGGNITPAGMLAIEDTSVVHDPMLVMGSFNSTGYIYKMSEIAPVYDDDGADFEVNIETGQLVYDSSAQWKRGLFTDIDISESITANEPIQLRHKYNGDLTESYQSSASKSTRSLQRFKGPSAYFRYLTTQISVQADIPFELFSITHWMSVKDRVSYAH